VREMQECGSRIEDAAKVFDEVLTAGEVKLSLRSESRSRMHAAHTCADAVRQGRGNAGPADEEEEEQQHEGLTTSSAQHGAAEATGSDAATNLMRQVGGRNCGAKMKIRKDLD
jgi:hypothetical protein